MSIKHLKPRSKWLVRYYKIKDFIFKKKNSVSFNIYTRDVCAEARIINCTVTREMVEDLEHFHGIEDIEEEFRKILENGNKTS